MSITTNTLELSSLQMVLIETISNQIVSKITQEDVKLSNEHIIAYLCSLVLDAIKDKKVTSEERILIVTRVICMVINELPLDESVKNRVVNFINDGEIQELLMEYETHASKKCMLCFGKLFRICLKQK